MYFLNINKPKGMTSFDVIYKLRKRLKIKQIGHSGTLDPLAYGVLQVGIGKATKLLDYLSSDKTYIADIKFGYTSETYDDEGEKKFIKEPDFTYDELNTVLLGFIGKTKQTPPMYSAIKVNGKKLCDIIRSKKADSITISPRDIEIYSIELLDFKKDSAKIKVHCKKGTYIRSLANDIGEKLACGAYLTDLIRTQAGNFKIENANEIDGELVELNPLDCLNLEKYELNEIELSKIKNGVAIESKTELKNQEILLTKDNKLVCLAKKEDNLIRPKKLFLGA